MILLDNFSLVMKCIGAIGLLLSLASKGHTRTHFLVQGYALIIIAVQIQ